MAGGAKGEASNKVSVTRIKALSFSVFLNLLFPSYGLRFILQLGTSN